MSALPKKLLTPEDYLAIEREADFKSEYFGGEMFAMAGASETHTLIISNVVRSLGNQVLDRNCYVYPNDMRVKVSAIGKYTYPDVVVVCGKKIFDDGQKDTILNPVLIIEVLSESTEAYDRGKKFEHYQYLESLSEYLLISQESYRIEQFVRQNDRSWTYYEFHDLDDVIKLATIGCELALKDVYLKIAIESTAR
jgi:Uma2 family endonuclease